LGEPDRELIEDLPSRAGVPQALGGNPAFVEVQYGLP
jgi:hypothetical protein